MPMWTLLLLALAQETPPEPASSAPGGLTEEADPPADASPAEPDPSSSTADDAEGEPDPEASEADSPGDSPADEPSEEEAPKAPRGPADSTGLLGLDGLPDEDGEDEVSEADVINSFISFAKVDRDDTRVRAVTGIHVGVGVPTVRLGPSPQLRTTFGVRFPQAGGRVMPWVSLTGTTAALRDTGSDPYRFDYQVRHSQGQVGLGSSVRIFHYREALSPELGFAPQLHVMNTTVGASVGNTDGGQASELLVRPGWTALAGVVVRPGALDLVVDLSVDGAPVRSSLSGDVAEYSINLRFGTRITHRPKSREDE